MNKQSVNRGLLAPVLAGFFIMGFCDIVAPISGRIASDFPAESEAVNFLPSMVFLWFLILSTPAAAMMNRLGRKRTALLGYALTVLSLAIPYIAGEGASLVWYFIGFGILGIGNTVVQVAVNPLLATIVPPQKMTSYLTVGQIFRNTSLLLLAPIVTALVVATGSWRLLLPIYGVLTLAGGIWLQLTQVGEEAHHAAASGFGDTLRLFRNPQVVISVLGVAAFIAADVGIGVLSVRLIDSPDSILTTTGFYASRIVGTILGAVLLLRISDLKYLTANMVAALALALVLMFTSATWAIYAAIALMGFTLACVFATFFAAATKAEPDHANEVSGLMIMAISAGALSGPICGAIAGCAGAARWGMIFVAACIIYMLWASVKLRTRTEQNEKER